MPKTGGSSKAQPLDYREALQHGFHLVKEKDMPLMDLFLSVSDSQSTEYVQAVESISEHHPDSSQKSSFLRSNAKTRMNKVVCS